MQKIFIELTKQYSEIQNDLKLLHDSYGHRDDAIDTMLKAMDKLIELHKELVKRVDHL
jgi:hypothetical protein